MSNHAGNAYGVKTESDIERYVLDIVATIESLDTINDAVICEGDGNYPATVADVTKWLKSRLKNDEILEQEYELAAKLIELSPELVEGDNGDVFQNYLDDVLSIEWLGTNSAGTNGEWVLTGAKVCVTIGGPNVFIESNLLGDSVEIVGAWGTDRAQAWAYAPGIVEYLKLYADTVE